MVGIQALNCSGVVFEREFGPYLIGVLWALAFASMMFLRVVVFPIPGSSRPEE